MYHRALWPDGQRGGDGGGGGDELGDERLDVHRARDGGAVEEALHLGYAAAARRGAEVNNEKGAGSDEGEVEAGVDGVGDEPVTAQVVRDEVELERADGIDDVVRREADTANQRADHSGDQPALHVVRDVVHVGEAAQLGAQQLVVHRVVVQALVRRHLRVARVARLRRVRHEHHVVRIGHARRRAARTVAALLWRKRRRGETARALESVVEGVVGVRRVHERRDGRNAALGRRGGR